MISTGSNNYWVKKISLVHKIYGFLMIAMSLLAIAFVIFGFSFGSLLIAYGQSSLGSLINLNLYINLMIAAVFGLLNIYIAGLLKSDSKYAIHLSVFSIVLMIFFVGSTLSYIVAVILVLLWALHFKINRFKFVNKRNMILLVVIIGAFSAYFIYQNKKSKDFCSEVFSGKYQELQAKLENGYDPNRECKDGLSALWHVCEPKKAELLLKYGANPNYINKKGQTPIFGPLFCYRNDYEGYLNVLMRYDADINHQDNDGNTALHFWGLHKRILNILEHNPDLTLKNKKDETALDIALAKYVQNKGKSNLAMLQLLISKYQNDKDYIKNLETTIDSITLSTSRTKLNRGEHTYIKVIANYLDDNLTKDVTYYVSWNIEPQNSIKIEGNKLTVLQDINTTIKARLGTFTSNPVSLEFSWQEDGYTLPPDANSQENNITIFGVDRNQNMIRDDVERFIFNTYKKHISCWQKEMNVTLSDGEIFSGWSKVCDKKENHYRDIALKAAETVQKILKNIEISEKEKEYLYTAIDCSIYFSNDRPKKTRSNSIKENQMKFKLEKEEITLIKNDMLKEREKLLDKFFDTDLRRQKYQEINTIDYHQKPSNGMFESCRNKIENLYQNINVK